MAGNYKNGGNIVDTKQNSSSNCLQIIFFPILVLRSENVYLTIMEKIQHRRSFRLPFMCCNVQKIRVLHPECNETFQSLPWDRCQRIKTSSTTEKDEKKIF